MDSVCVLSHGHPCLVDRHDFDEIHGVVVAALGVTICAKRSSVESVVPRAFRQIPAAREDRDGWYGGGVSHRAFGMAGFEKILVIKRVLDHMAADEEFDGMFIDEARIAVRLYVNIVQVFDWGGSVGIILWPWSTVLNLSRLLTRSRNIGPFPIPLALIGRNAEGPAVAHQRIDDQGRPMQIVHVM